MVTEYDWMYAVIDSSRVSTFLVSILLIVYGSFRSLNMDERAKEEHLQHERETLETGRCPSDGATLSRNAAGAGFQSGLHASLDTVQAMCLPIGASISLLVMFFFFDSMQTLFAACTAVIATMALAFLLLPMCQYLLRPCSRNEKRKISCGICGRFSLGEMVSFLLSSMIVFVWILTGHWLLMDALGMGLCVAFIAFVRLPSLKVSTLLLTGLLLYDVFWVFFSSYIFNSNVMVKVAMRSADNPMKAMVRKLHLHSMSAMVNDAPRLSLPGKLVFPGGGGMGGGVGGMSAFSGGVLGRGGPGGPGGGHYSMLGLGDIVMPGLLLCFVMRYDKFKQSQHLSAEAGVPLPRPYSRLSYFQCSLIGYILGLLTATICSEFFKAAQPALLYLVPSTLLPLIIMSYLRGDFFRMWNGGFDMLHPHNSASTPQSAMERGGVADTERKRFDV